MSRLKLIVVGVVIVVIVVIDVMFLFEMLWFDHQPPDRPEQSDDGISRLMPPDHHDSFTDRPKWRSDRCQSGGVCKIERPYAVSPEPNGLAEGRRNKPHPPYIIDAYIPRCKTPPPPFDPFKSCHSIRPPTPHDGSSLPWPFAHLFTNRSGSLVWVFGSMWVYWTLQSSYRCPAWSLPPRHPSQRPVFWRIGGRDSRGNSTRVTHIHFSFLMCLLSEAMGDWAEINDVDHN